MTVADQPGLVVMLWRGYRTTARCLIRMLVPAAVLLIPLAMASTLAGVLLPGRDAVLVNHDLQGIPTADGLSETTESVVLMAALLLSALVVLVCLAAGIVMAAGQLLGRPVRAATGLATALRRLPTLLAFVGLAGLLGFATLLVLRTFTPPIWLFVALPVAAGLLVLPFATALPAAILERRGLVGALRRAAAVTRFRRVEVATALLFGMGLVPGLTGLAGWMVPQLVGGQARSLVGPLITIAGATLALPFAAATLAAVYLTEGDNDRDRDRIQTHLPAAAPPSTPVGRGLVRGGLLATGLALPGLLHAGYVWSNPLDLAVVTDQVLVTAEDGYPGALPRLHHDAAGRVVAMWAPDRSSRWSAGALVCGDLDCTGHPRLSSSEIAEFAPAKEAPWWDTAPLPDGSVAVAAWLPSPAPSPAGGPAFLLLLGDCRTDRCELPDPESAPVLAEVGRDQGETEYYLAAAVAAGPDGGPVFAHLRPHEEVYAANLGLTICADRRCDLTQTVVLARDISLGPFSLDRVRPVDVAVGPDGTVVVAVLDVDDGAVSLHTCHLPDCQQPAETEVVAPAARRTIASNHTVEVAVRPDGSPVLTYVDAWEGTHRLLICHTRDCSDHTDISLSEGARPPPALALDDRGRPLVATYQAQALVLVRCLDSRCASRETLPLAKVGAGAGYLDLSLTPDGRPQVLWADSDGRRRPRSQDLLSVSLRLTTCAAPDCR